jgi:hypothetical protein
MGSKYVAELSALLDFYSDRSTSHASFFVVTLFGIFTILSILDNVKNIFLLALIYWLLVVAGFFLLARFTCYNDYSQGIRHILIHYPKMKKLEMLACKLLNVTSIEGQMIFIHYRTQIIWSAYSLIYNKIIFRFISGGYPVITDSDSENCEKKRRKKYWNNVICYLDELGYEDTGFNRLFKLVIGYFSIVFLSFVTVFEMPIQDIIWIPNLSIKSILDLVLLVIIIVIFWSIKKWNYKSLEQRRESVN